MIAEPYAVSQNLAETSDADGSFAETSREIVAASAPEALSNAGDVVSSTSSLEIDGSGAGLSSSDAGNANGAAMYSNQQDIITSYDANERFSNLANSSLEPARVEGYNSSLNTHGALLPGNEASASSNGVTSSERTGSAALYQPGLTADEERLWSIVTANSLEFDAWTALIEETERTSEGNVSKIRKVYDAFLAEFPLCYGYWKKYADHEARLSSTECVAEVYERAVNGVTYSVDMWLHYCVFAIKTFGDPEAIRRLFERALAYVGTDYLCFPIWDKFIEYEISQQAWPRIAAIYTRVLEVPNQQLDRHFEGFKELVASRPLSDMQASDDATATATSVAVSEDANEENKETIPPSDTEQSSEAVSARVQDAEDLEKYITIREEIYKKAKDFDYKIVGFETAIRRPYFHVRPLNVAELENWHNYLDYIESGDDFNKVFKLYERCLIACANYPEYWIRYILCMEASGSMELAENALARATQVFVKRQPEIHLFAARFREHLGDISGARASYQQVHTGISPGLIEAIIKHANMERRLGNLENACSLYEQAIAIEKGKEQSQTLPMLFAQYSRFIYLVSGNVDRAREILVQGVESAQLCKHLLEAMIHLEAIQPQPKQVEYLDSLVDKFIVPTPEFPSSASTEEREEVSNIFLEFLDIFGDVQLIKKADNRHAKLFLRQRSSTESRKKRHAEDYLVSDRVKFAKSLTSAPASSIVDVYAGAQNQWPAGYGVQPQVWNPGYAQQTAYAGSYGATYAQQQVPTSVPAPQSAAVVAYGTSYPPTYAAQAFPQAYAQPAVAPTLTSAQQPASASATSYYASYY